MKIGHIFAGAGLLVLPFVVSGVDAGEQFRDPKVRMLALLFGLWIATELWRKVHPSLGCVAGFLFLHLASTSMLRIDLNLVALIATFGSCLWVAQAGKDDVERGLEILEISGVLCAGLAAVFQLQPGLQTFVQIPPGAFPSAAFGQQTLYGPFAVACFASALFHGRHFRALLLLIPIFICSSSFTFLSLGVVLFLFGFSRLGKRAVLGAVMAVLLFAAGSKIWPSETLELRDDKGRFLLWSQTIRLANRHWLLGHGFASFRVIYPIFQDPNLRAANGIDDAKQSPEMRAFFKESELLRIRSGIFLHPHSEPLLVYFQFGVIGLLIALWWAWVFVITAFEGPIGSWYYGWIFREARSPWKAITPTTWALIAIFFSSIADSFGNFNFHLIPQVLLPLWAFVAVTTQREEGTLEEYAAC